MIPVLEALGFFLAVLVVLLFVGALQVAAIALLFEVSAWRRRRRARRRGGLIEPRGWSS